MRAIVVLLALLFTVQAPLACPVGYHVCGANAALCCR
jgi:hypothetical protein